MKIINCKKEAIKELKRISTRTNSENNNKILVNNINLDFEIGLIKQAF